MQKEANTDLVNSKLVERFYNDHRSSNATETALVNFVKHNYEKVDIVEKVIKLVGMPRWDKISVFKDPNASLVNTSNTPTTYYIPLVIDTKNSVNATMVVHTTASDTSLTYLQDWQYHNMQNNNNSYTDDAENYAVFFMRQDMNVFGYKSFKILDTNLFRFNNRKVDSVTLNPQVTVNNLFLIVTTTCQNITMFVDCLDAPFNGIGNLNLNSTPFKCYINWNYCTSSTTVISDGIGNGTPSGMIFSGGGGGGGGGWDALTIDPITAAIMYVSSTLQLDGLQWWFADPVHAALAVNMKDYLIQNNSSPQAIAICNAHLNKMMNDNDYLDFVIENPDNIQNVFYAYQTEIESEVTNPCIQSLITSIGAAGFKKGLIKLYQNKTFGQKSAYKIKFKQSASVIGNDGNQVYAKNEPVVTLANGKKQITILLNTSLLNSTVSKEYTATVILHEILHSLYSIEAPGTSQYQQHLNMFQGADVLEIARAVNDLFPSLSFIDAVALSLEGFDEITFPGGNIDLNRNTFAENNYGMGLIYAKNKANQYKSGPSGLGTPC